MLLELYLLTHLVIQLEDGIHIRHCDCIGGYYGDVCTIDNCTPDPCNGKGTCNVVDNANGYECDCGVGHYVRCPSYRADCISYTWVILFSPDFAFNGVSHEINFQVILIHMSPL